MKSASEVARAFYGYEDCIGCASKVEEGTRMRGFRDENGILHIVSKKQHEELTTLQNKRK